MRKNGKLVSSLVCACLVGTAFASCGGGENGANGRTIVNFWTQSSASTATAWVNTIKAYNDGQGKEDGVYVAANYNAGDATLQSALATSAAPNVANIGDKLLKTYTSLGYCLELDEYLTSEAKTAMLWNEIPETMKYRFMYDNKINPETGKKTAGKGQPTVGLPNGRIASYIWYNEEILARSGVQIISVAETELESYNAAHGTSYQPHGYAEYKADPSNGTLSSSQNKDTGATVYKVLNNRIAMNWDEFRYLCKYIKTYDSAVEYSYALEYWFDYAWSIGGDVIGWDTEKGEYVFTLDDKTANYLVLQDNVTLNGNVYNKGEVVRYEDRAVVNASEIGDDKTFHELPSTYDAFLEFSRLGVTEDKTVDSVDGVDYKGYGLANVARTNQSQYFRAGNSPFLYGVLSSASTLDDGVVKGKFDATLMYQWREYEGGTLTSDGKLKTIGETYDGETYTGKIAKSASGVELKGRQCVTSENYGLILAKNADSSKYEASFKFASWLAGPEGQKMLAKGNNLVPNQSSVAFSEEYLTSSDRVFKNVWAAAFAGEDCDMGDWSYFEDGQWVTNWANELNNNVRFGAETLTKFYQNKKGTANNDLAAMKLRIYRR